MMKEHPCLNMKNLVLITSDIMKDVGFDVEKITISGMEEFASWSIKTPTVEIITSFIFYSDIRNNISLEVSFTADKGFPKTTFVNRYYLDMNDPDMRQKAIELIRLVVRDYKEITTERVRRECEALKKASETNPTLANLLKKGK